MDVKRLLLFFLSLLMACENTDDRLSNNPINSKIFIEARELLGPNTRSLTFFCKTETNYPCINYPINYSFSNTESLYNITFSDVGEVGLCFTAIGPATATINLNSIPNGVYQLEINNANLHNKGSLKVSDSEINLNFSEQNGIEIVRQNTLRVPAKTFWGTVGYHTTSSEILVTEFFQKLKNEGVLFEKQKSGNYFYYSIDNKGDIVTNNENSGYHYSKAFAFQFNGDEIEFKKKVKTIASSYFDDLYIYIETYKGETINNWTK